jgi:glycosyltransferase involved in cell wall biosynthesis
LSNVDDIVGVSPALHEQIALFFPRQARLIPYGIHDDLFTPLTGSERQAVRAGWGASEGDVVFQFLGSLSERKGLDLLAEAFTRLAPTHPDWRLWVIGPRSRAENQNLVDAEVQRMLAPLQNHPQVSLLGRIDDRARLARLLAAGDVFVFPSRREGMGIAPMEAMSAGVPAIIALLPGITDQANIDGVTGLYVAPGSAAGLASALQRLGEDAALRRQMGAAARQRILQDFNWQQYLQRWEDLYRGGLGPG